MAHPTSRSGPCSGPLTQFHAANPAASLHNRSGSGPSRPAHVRVSARPGSLQFCPASACPSSSPPRPIPEQRMNQQGGSGISHTQDNLAIGHCEGGPPLRCRHYMKLSMLKNEPAGGEQHLPHAGQPCRQALCGWSPPAVPRLHETIYELHGMPVVAGFEEFSNLALAQRAHTAQNSLDVCDKQQRVSSRVISSL